MQWPGLGFSVVGRTDRGLAFPSRAARIDAGMTISFCDIIRAVKSKHRKVLAALFTRPTPAGIAFADIEALLQAIGCEVEEGAGSRIAFIRGNARLYLHRPHPGKEAKRYQVEQVRDFLQEQGIEP